MWAALSRFREFAPTADDGLVGAALAGLAAAVLLGPRATGLGRARLMGLIVVCLIAAHAALHGAGQFFLFAVNRADAVTLLPPLWAAMSGLAGLWAWSASRGPGRWLGPLAHGAVVVALPAAAAGQLTSRLPAMMFTATLFCLASTAGGLVVSYSPNFPAGATIIIIAGLLYLGSLAFSSIHETAPE